MARTRVLLAALLVVLGLTSCGGNDGLVVYDEDFRSNLQAYIGESVTLSADVHEVISPASFTIEGADEAVEPLLVVAENGALLEINPGMTVRLAGVVQAALDPAAVEETLGTPIDDDTLRAWAGEPYLQAIEVDTFVDGDG